MKNTLLTMAIALVSYFSYAQTNIFPTSGNVGIGTTTPGALLTLNTNYITDFLLNRSPAQYARVVFSTGGTYKWYIGMDNDATPNTDSFVIEGPTSTNFAINQSGNIGMGTVSPMDKLDVNGNISLSGGAKEIHFRDAMNITKQYFWLTNSNALALGVGSELNSMFIVNTGNVGIGTTTPDAKLAVNGTIHSKEVKVDLTGWPDYVFKPKYTLPSLSEVKTYIDKNKHLPEMRSEQEMVKNGLKVSEIMQLQIKKIEELTLYLIDKDKQLTDQQKQSQQQELRIAALEKAIATLTINK